MKPDEKILLAMNLTVKECRDIINKWFKAFPGITKWSRSIKEVKTDGSS